MMIQNVVIYWFRQDLRLSDNPALTLAANYEKHVLPVYIFDNKNAGDWAIGAASSWHLHHSLIALNNSLSDNLSFYNKNPIDVFEDIIARFNIHAVCWNKCYEPWQMEQDEKIKKYLQARSIEVKTANGSLLWEPEKIKKSDGTPYKVFTPFYRNGCLTASQPRNPLPVPENIRYLKDEKNSANFGIQVLLPYINWYKKFEPYLVIGEKESHNRFQKFLKTGLIQYKEGRNFPSKPYVSCLSSNLHFGEISVNILWHTVCNISTLENMTEIDENIDCFCSELGWREFAHNLLYHNPDLPKKNLQSKFDIFPWIEDAELLNAWKRGKTGIPTVDAGMRELWQTGYMHNRMRMIVGSFLVKNLRLHWHHGAQWFWDTLTDADLANNSASWQWISGCGADAAPYFRIFNPVTQGKKFDAEGDYVRRFVPEIALLQNKYLFSPWEAPVSILEKAGIDLGTTYPNPIVDLKQSRINALNAFFSLEKESL